MTMATYFEKRTAVLGALSLGLTVAVTGLGVIPDSPEYGLGLFLAGEAFTLIAALNAYIAHGKAEGFGLAPLRILRDFFRRLGVQSPLYFRDKRDALLLSAQISAKAEKLALAAAALSEAQTEVTFVQARANARSEEKDRLLSEERNTNERLRRQIAEQSSAFNSRDADAREYCQRLTYGRKYPAVDAIEQGDLAILVGSLHELKPTVKNLVSAYQAIWEFVKRESVKQSQISPTGWLCSYVDESEYARMEAAFGGLRAELIAKRDPRPLLQIAYYAYRDWRTAVGRLAATMGRQLPELPGYEAWRSAEIGFAAKLEDKLSLPALDGVRILLEHYESTHGALSAPPPLNTTAELGDYGQAVVFLASMTKDEECFLSLFSTAVSPMVVGQPDTFLAYATYRAGENLATKGILTKTTTSSDQVTFFLSEVVHRAWCSSGRSALPVRRSVDIDLKSVRASGSSGSGR
jgi:hypothetical protein